jgi:hypothetical protein
MSRTTVLQIVLWAICVYHIVLGGGAFLSSTIAEQTARSIFGIALHMDEQTAYVVRVLGVYALTFGLVAGIAATDPVRHRLLLNVVVVLYVLRIVAKLVFKDEAVMGLAYTEGRIYAEAAMLAAFAAAVLFLRPRTSTVSRPA